MESAKFEKRKPCHSYKVYGARFRYVSPLLASMGKGQQLLQLLVKLCSDLTNVAIIAKTLLDESCFC